MFVLLYLMLFKVVAWLAVDVSCSLRCVCCVAVLLHDVWFVSFCKSHVFVLLHMLFCVVIFIIITCCMCVLLRVLFSCKYRVFLFVVPGVLHGMCVFAVVWLFACCMAPLLHGLPCLLFVAFVLCVVASFGCVLVRVACCMSRVLHVVFLFRCMRCC